MRKLMLAATVVATASPTYAGNIGGGFTYVAPNDTYVENYVYIQQPYRVIQAPPQIIYRYVQPGRDAQTGQCYDLDLC